MTPGQPLVDENLVDPTPLDRDPFLFIEVGLEPVQGPAGEGQAEGLGIDQSDGDDLGTLFGGIGVGTPGSRLILQTRQSLFVEAMNPKVNRGPTDAQVPGHLAGPLSLGDSQKDLGALDEAGLFGTRRS